MQMGADRARVLAPMTADNDDPDASSRDSDEDDVPNGPMLTRFNPRAMISWMQAAGGPRRRPQHTGS